MLSKPIKATSTEIVVFTSSEYRNDVQDFQEGVNSWLHTQPDNIVIEDIVYQHCGTSSRGKDVFSIAIVSRAATKDELK
ncbi:MAG: hypothetical protein JW856_03395 [Dehalococcoidales bacterium]|nr:hypothetical protein [Dehalococcoidales bacterium]